MQGDVIGIVDGNTGTQEIARYEYDTWGKLISIKDGSGNDVTNNTVHIGYLNPIRYRSYYYDHETEFYYLQDRYYDSTTGRFINADTYANTGGLTGLNRFAYCGNDPINMVDPDGCRRKPRVTKSSKQKSDEATEAWVTFWTNLENDFSSFNLFNTDEQKVLDSHYFSAYKGQFVIRGSINGRSGSFGIMVLGKESYVNIDTVKHEWGHFVQLRKIGLVQFIFKIAIPSATSKVSDSYHYYSQPWEVTADIYGGVNRAHVPGSEAAGMEYFDNIIPSISALIEKIQEERSKKMASYLDKPRIFW